MTTKGRIISSAVLGAISGAIMRGAGMPGALSAVFAVAISISIFSRWELRQSRRAE